MGQTADVRASVSRWRALEPALRLVSATVLIGAALGAVIGGLGGRLAMRILFLTSDDKVKGITSDDGFEIGRFTLVNTLGLIVVTTFIGVVAALLYLVAQPIVAAVPFSNAALMGIFYGVVGGALMVNPDGVDFTLLEPALLAIGLFVVICAGFGVAVAHFVDAAAADGGWPARRSAWLMRPPLLIALFPFFLLPAVAALVLHGAADAAEGADGDDRVWRVVRTAGLVVMAGLFLLGAVKLVHDTATLT